MTNAPDDFRDTRDDRDIREPRRNDRRDVKLDSRIPPHNVDAEASLLGSMMLDDNPVGLAIDHQLHQHRLVAARQRVLHRLEARDEETHAIFLARLPQIGRAHV